MINIDWKPLPYFSKRWGKVKFIVVHWSGGYTLNDAFETLKQRKLSYHYLVDGGTIWSLVDEKNIAYHAGNWIANTQSVGVCHIGIYEQPVKEDSYATSGQLLAEICRRNGLEPNEKTIVPHRSIKTLFGSGTATSCPGSLDLMRLIGEARKYYFGIVPEVIPQIIPTPVENPHPEPVVPVSLFPKVVVTTGTVRRRKETNTTSDTYGTVPANTSVTVWGEYTGETINSNNIWYDTHDGYIWSGATK